jgi:hypothetical protein
MGWRRRLVVLSLAFGVFLPAVIGQPGVTEAAQKASEPLLASGSGPQPLPTGPAVKLALAGALAVGPTGALYVAAPLQHRIVVRLADGQYRVVAGNGEQGFSGDGGTAIDANLTRPSDLTFGPGGDLYFVDGGRVRMVDSEGLIYTVAGDGAYSAGVPGSYSPSVADGTPALSASLGSSPAIALSPTVQLYIDTPRQLLRLTSDGRFDTVPTRRASFGATVGLPGSLDMNLGSIAVDSQGNLDVAGFNGWGVWRVAHDGAATYLGYARGGAAARPLTSSEGLRALFTRRMGQASCVSALQSCWRPTTST